MNHISSRIWQRAICIIPLFLLLVFLFLGLLDMQDANIQFREQYGEDVVIIQDNRSVWSFFIKTFYGEPDSYTVIIKEGDLLKKCYLDKPGAHWIKVDYDNKE